MVAHFMLSGSLRMNILFTTPTLFVQAANYLDIKGLLDVTCKTVANMIKGKTPEEIRKTFNIKNDFTEEEEAQVPARLCSCVQSAGRKKIARCTSVDVVVRTHVMFHLPSLSGAQGEPVV